MGEQAFPEAHKPTLSYRCKCLGCTSTLCFAARTQDELSTCILGRCFGLFPTFILRNPTAMAPEETMTTRWPSFMRATAVSTMRERIDSKGSCVFSWTIELDPMKRSSQQLYPSIPHSLHTELNHDGEMFLALHAYLFGNVSHLAIALHVKARERPDPTALTGRHLTRYDYQKIRRKNLWGGDFLPWLGATEVCDIESQKLHVINNFLVKYWQIILRATIHRCFHCLLIIRRCMSAPKGENFTILQVTMS